MCYVLAQIRFIFFVPAICTHIPKQRRLSCLSFSNFSISAATSEYTPGFRWMVNLVHGLLFDCERKKVVPGKLIARFTVFLERLSLFAATILSRSNWKVQALAGSLEMHYLLLGLRGKHRFCRPPSTELNLQISSSGKTMSRVISRAPFMKPTCAVLCGSDGDFSGVGTRVVMS